MIAVSFPDPLEHAEIDAATASAIIGLSFI
jgi:hypothetical protein